ncbi:MAG TPA: hypothetical protein VGF95_05085 [Solirubrobacteraceae bacterium]|jgi:hypothetical protein
MSESTSNLCDLPIFGELRSELLTAFIAHEQSEQARSRSDIGQPGFVQRLLRWLRSPLAIVLVAVSVSGTGIALAITLGGGHAVTPREWESGHRAVPEQKIVPAQAAQLGILRSARTAYDVVPSSLVPFLANSLFAGANGANFGLARRAQGFSSGAAWVVPGAGNVCLVAVSALSTAGQVPKDAEIAADCKPDRLISEGALAYSGGDDKPDEVFVAGLVPDGVGTVMAKLAGGGEEELTVHDNVYMAALNGSASLYFEAFGKRTNLGEASSLAERNRRKCLATHSAASCKALTEGGH